MIKVANIIAGCERTFINSTLELHCRSDVNKDCICKDKDTDKDQAYKDQNKDKDQTCKDKDKDLTHKNQDKDKDFTYSYLLQVAAKPTIAIKQHQ